MEISLSTDDQLMVMAAHRYCLGRQSYIVGSCINWLTNHWNQISPGTQDVILRDTLEALAKDRAGSDYDAKAWRVFASKIIQSLNDERTHELQATAANDIPDLYYFLANGKNQD